MGERNLEMRRQIKEASKDRRICTTGEQLWINDEEQQSVKKTKGQSRRLKPRKEACRPGEKIWTRENIEEPIKKMAQQRKSLIISVEGSEVLKKTRY